MPLSPELRAQIVAAARGYVGADYTHQGMTASRMDCRGLPLRVGRELNLVHASAVAIGYGRQPNPERLKAMLNKYMEQVPVAEVQDGDVLLLRMPRLPQHLALLATMESGGEQWLTIIHADNVAGKVVEHRLDDEYRRRIESAWRFMAMDGRYAASAGCAGAALEPDYG